MLMLDSLQNITHAKIQPSLIFDSSVNLKKRETKNVNCVFVHILNMEKMPMQWKKS